MPLIHIICKQGSTKVLLRILDKSNLEVTDEKGRTPLLVLCGEYVPLQCIEHALYLGANVNAVDLVCSTFLSTLLVLIFLIVSMANLCWI